MGPVVSEEQREKITSYIDVGIKEGATLETGGEELDQDGYFVDPAVFTDVDPDMRIAREEIFDRYSVLSFRTRTKPLRSPTIRTTGSSRASSRRTSIAPTDSRARSRLETYT